MRRRCTETVDGETFYQALASSGNQWNGAFRGIVELWRREGEAIAKVDSARAGDRGAGYGVHPAVLDACVQGLAATSAQHLGGAATSRAFVLASMDRIRVHRGLSGAVWSHVVRREEDDPLSLCGDIMITDEAGELLAEIGGLRLRYIDRAAPVSDWSSWLYQVRWRPAAARPGVPRPGRLVVFADRVGTADALAAHSPVPMVRVTAAGRYRRQGADQCEIDGSSADDYRRLFGELGGAASDPQPAGVVFLWALDLPNPDGAGAPAGVEPCGAVAHILDALTTVGVAATPVWLVTRAAQQVTGSDSMGGARQAVLWGLGRSLAHEHPEIRWRLLDLPPGADGVGSTRALAAELAAADDGEDQIAVRADGRYVARLVPSPVPAGAGAAVGSGPPRSNGAVPTSGALAVRPGAPAPGPGTPAPNGPTGPDGVGPGDVAIAVTHAAIGGPAGGGHGWACAGRVTAVGDRLAGVAVGDEVVAVPSSAPVAAGTMAYADGRLTFPLPAGLSAQEAVTIPMPFLVAYIGLCELANLAHGERVLVHDGTSGVGLAAIQIARWRGAEIYATAGSPQQRALLRMLGLAAVAGSAPAEFEGAVRALTRGEGVDVVLETAARPDPAGDPGVLAPFGRQVRVSDRGNGAPPDPAPGPGGPNVSLHSLDVPDLVRRRPRWAGGILRTVLTLVEAGVLHPLPHEVYQADGLAEAPHRVPAPPRVGQVVLALDPLPAAVPAGPGPAAPRTPERPTRPTEPPARLPAVRPAGRIRSDGTYLISGGLGDLGLAVARWLVQRGARHLLLLGRRTPPPRAQWAALPADHAWQPRTRILHQLERAGARVEVEAVDVADADAVRDALRHHASAGRPPVCGVVHAAGLISYEAFGDTDHATLVEMLRSKVDGGWVLHDVLQGQPLDLFVLFASAAGVLGAPMLAGYAAANAGLDGLAHYRRARGLPALAIDWGFWADAGMAFRVGREHSRVLTPQGMTAFSAADGVAVLEALIARDDTGIVVLPTDWNRWGSAYPDVARMPFLREVAAPATEAAQAVQAVQAVQAPPAQRASAVPVPELLAPPVAPAAAERSVGPEGVRAYLAEQVGQVLGLPAQSLNPRRPLNRQGLDSLMAAQIRAALHRDFGVFVPLTRMLSGASITELAADVAQEMVGQRRSETTA